MGREGTDSIDTNQGHESPRSANLSDDIPSGKYLTGFHLWLVFVALALSVFLIGLDFVSCSLSVPAPSTVN
jgi:hypothetical protein